MCCVRLALGAARFQHGPSFACQPPSQSRRIQASQTSSSRQRRLCKASGNPAQLASVSVISTDCLLPHDRAPLPLPPGGAARAAGGGPATHRLRLSHSPGFLSFFPPSLPLFLPSFLPSHTSLPFSWIVPPPPLPLFWLSPSRFFVGFSRESSARRRLCGRL